MERKNEEQEQEYSLYTEKIVPSPKVKYKHLILIIKILIFVIIAGIYYILMDKLIVPHIQQKFLKSSNSVDMIEFTRDEYPDMLLSDSEDGQQQMKNDYDAIMQSLRSRVEEVWRSVVIVQENTIDIPYENYIENMDNEDNILSTTGLIVGHINGKYMILTSKQYTDNVNDISVIMHEENEYKASLVCSDNTTGISIISVEDDMVLDNDKQYVNVSQLDNSYVLNKGDIVIAAGTIYGTSGAVDYGTLTNKTTYNSIDNSYEIFETNLACKDGDYGFLFNSEGNVVGISLADSDGKLKAMGISDLKSMIECMINRQGKMYFGIKAQNVDSELSEKYELPMGIYILKVDRDSPAYQAGLQAGDIIQGINGASCYSIQRLNDKLYDSAINQALNISIKRMGKNGYFDASYDVTVELKQ